MFREVFDKMMNADGIILGSPVYCANISANMRNLGENMAYLLKTLNCKKRLEDTK